MLIHRFCAWLVGVMLMGSTSTYADPADGMHSAEMENATAAAMAAQISGPKNIPLGEQAVLALPAQFSFIPKEESINLLRATGNQPGSGLYGIVVGEDMKGFVIVRFENAGYVKDDDAKDWNADDLLQSLKDGTEAGNEERRQRGIPEFVVSGWIEKPIYDTSTHRLVWAAEVRDKIPTAASEDGASANYNTYQLGREGYISMNLVTNATSVNAEKPIAWKLLTGLQFNEGKRYTDFQAATDKVATYGLAALIGGIAAKKLGLLALITAFLIKFAKVLFAGVVIMGAAIRKFFGRKQ